MIVRLKKNLYDKTAIFKAAFHFTDDYYLYIDTDENDFIVSIDAKAGETNPKIVEQFCNEAIAQETRIKVFNDTKEIREMILARSFASTIIEEKDSKDVEEEVDGNPFEVWNG